MQICARWWTAVLLLILWPGALLALPQRSVFFAQNVNPPASGGVEPTFTMVQGVKMSLASAGSGPTISVALNAAPSAGNAIVCAVYDANNISIVSIKDNATTPNNYTITPHSP